MSSAFTGAWNPHSFEWPHYTPFYARLGDWRLPRLASDRRFYAAAPLDSVPGLVALASAGGTHLACYRHHRRTAATAGLIPAIAVAVRTNGKLVVSTKTTTGEGQVS